MNNAGINKYVLVLSWTTAFNSHGLCTYTPTGGTVGSDGNSMFSPWKAATLFSESMHYLISPPAMNKCASISTSSITPTFTFTIEVSTAYINSVCGGREEEERRGRGGERVSCACACAHRCFQLSMSVEIRSQHGCAL